MDTGSFASPAADSTLSKVMAGVRRAFVGYARWLSSIGWWRFWMLSLLALIVSGILSGLPPFSLKWTDDKRVLVSADTPTPKKKKRGVVVMDEKDEPLVIDGISDGKGKTFSISIDDKGVHLKRNPGPASGAGSAAPPAPPAAPALPALPVLPALPSASAAADMPPEPTTKESIKQAIREAQEAVREAAADAAEAEADAAAARLEATGMRYVTQEGFSPGPHLPPFTFLLIVLSIVTKIMATGRFKAEAQAVVATEMAESEALKRQVIEARMAAMQAQVEPHFLFNTLASIDHLIETDPPRASKMQKNLIALLRASMPTMREANAQGTRDLGREMSVIRPYLEILKVRMEERLHTEIRVSDGLLSAEFPPMMLQSLVENAIKHGLEPKAEGGTLGVSAEIVHGRLAVTVADTGLGFASSQQQAATAGTGIGLSNIRERLQLLYGHRAALTVAENPGGGTAVTITVPYKSTSAEGVST